ncbi:hypothetical protein AVEN_58827-1 [Araneus ventricosus]|uniref:Uncharacterized protein n=1 Tax=Araneus ventricosus TaxID=182803 RepID=A0A4Y2TY62_ARAVE|nr:hypothetical protein AVEN_58827-1 [Araneus ventricosus]
MFGARYVSPLAISHSSRDTSGFKRDSIRKEYWSPLALVSNCDVHGPMQLHSDAWGQRHTKNRYCANSPPSLQSARHSLRDLLLPAAAESCDASCRAVSVLRRLVHCNR